MRAKARNTRPRSTLMAVSAPIAILVIAAAGCGPSMATLVQTQRYPEACVMTNEGAPSRAEEMQLAEALADELGFEVEARLLTQGEAEERLGLAPGPEYRFVSFRWRARAAPLGATVRASPMIFRPAGEGALRWEAISIREPDSVFPPPASLTPLPMPRPYVRQAYEPTPRPQLRYTGGRGPNALESAVSGVASALTLGLVRRSTGVGGHLTPASRRALARWEEANREPKRLFDLEQDRLVAEDAEARARIQARNEEIPAERAEFGERRSALIREVADTNCDGDGWTRECEEIRVLPARQIEHASRLSATAYVRFRENSCGLVLYHRGQDADSVGAAVAQPIELYSVGDGR